MLAQNTQIPTAARGQVRALVKAHEAWPAYLTQKDIISARARNADLLEFARMHPELAAQVAQVLNLQPAVLQLPAGWTKQSASEGGLPPGWTPMRVYALTAAIEHMLQNFSKRQTSRAA